jgi:hypothetical protein
VSDWSCEGGEGKRRRRRRGRRRRRRKKKICCECITLGKGH